MGLTRHAKHSSKCPCSQECCGIFAKSAPEVQKRKCGIRANKDDALGIVYVNAED